MRLIGNIIWLIFGGLAASIGYFFTGILFCLTIIGIPFGLQCFKIGVLVLLPFGKKVVSSSTTSGCLATLFNIIWIICGGLYTAFVHLVFALLLYITIIGIPFARQHIKLAGLTLSPFGKDVVDA